MTAVGVAVPAVTFARKVSVAIVASAVMGIDAAGKSPVVNTDHSRPVFAEFTRRCWNAAEPARAAGTAEAFVAFASTLFAASRKA